jgi:hypothetical protein
MTITLNGTTGITTPDVSTTTETISGGTANGVQYLNGSKAVTTGAALTFDGTNLATTGSVSATNTFGFKNRIINGAMMIDQRNSGASVNANAAYPVDRFLQLASGGGVLTSQQSTTIPAGFKNSLYTQVTTADSSIAAGDYYLLRQPIEGFNVSDLGWGAAGASSITLSFWVRSSVTGTFSGALENATEDRSYPFTYTISSANTFEQKSITVAGDTTGTWATNNTVGIYLNLDLGSGSNFKNTASAWVAAKSFGATGATNLISTVSATFYITGVQLEKGTVATSFDFRDYGRELILCQRYCTKFGGISTNDAFGSGFSAGSTFYIYVPLPVAMRTTPSFTVYGTASDINTTAPGIAAAANATPSVIGTGVASSVMQISSGSSISSGYAVYSRLTSASTWFTLTAEL